MATRRSMREPGQFRFALESDCLAVSLAAFCPYYYARLGNGWVLALAGGDGKSGCGELEVRVEGCEPPTYHRVELEGDALVLTGEGEGWAITTRCRVRDGGAGLHVRTMVEFNRDVSLERLRSSLWFVPGGKPLSQYAHPEEAWVPHLRPDQSRPTAEQVCASPVLALQHGGIGAIVIPEPGGVRGQRVLQGVLDLDLSDPRRDAPRISCALRPLQAPGGRMASPEARFALRLPAGATVAYGYNIWLLAGVDRGETRRSAIRRLWHLRGHPQFRHAHRQRRPWSEYAESVFPVALSSRWHKTILAGKTVGGVQARGAENVISFGAFENALESAYGLYWWGERLKRRTWRETADQVRNLILAAPMRSGCFPSEFDTERQDWAGGESLSHAFETGRMAWSAYWMVRWHRDLRPTPELLRRATTFGELLATTQLPSGAFPRSFRTTDLHPAAFSRENSATAVGVLFLAELAGAARRPAFAHAARRGAEFLVGELVARELYFESNHFEGNPEAPTLDPVTCATLHGTLTILRTAEALRALYELTQETRLLHAGVRALDHLCAFQVAKGPAAHEFGAFAVDTRATSCRHVCPGAFAETFLHYFRLTGIREYFERGVATLRASFANGGDLAALAAAAIVQRRFGSIYIDAARGFAGGIDGCSARVATNLKCRAEITESLGRARSLELVVEGLPSGAVVRWNGRPLRVSRTNGGLRASVPAAAHARGALGWRPGNR